MIARVGPPNYYNIQQEVDLGLFDDATDWTANNCTVSDDTDQQLSGHSVKVSAISSSSAFIRRLSISPNYDITSPEKITFLIYAENLPASGASLIFYFSENNLSSDRHTTISANQQTHGPIREGWNFLSMHTISPTTWLGSGSFTDSMNALQITFTNCQGATFYIDSMLKGHRSRPKVIFGADDAHNTFLDIYNYALDRGIPGAIAVNGSFIDDASHFSKAQLQTLVDAGCTVANHAWEHVNLADETLASVITNVSRNQDWLRDNGFDDGSFFVYPENSHNPQVISVVQDYGYNMARAAANSIMTPHSVYGIDNPYRIGSYTFDDKTLKQAKDFLDDVIRIGGTCWMYGHKVVAGNPAETDPPPAGTDWYEGWYEQWIDYFEEKIAEGLVDAVGIHDWVDSLPEVRRVRR